MAGNQTSPSTSDPFSSSHEIQQNHQNTSQLFSDDHQEIARHSSNDDANRHEQPEEPQLEPINTNQSKRNTNNNINRHIESNANLQATGGNPGSGSDAVNNAESGSAQQSWFQRMVDNYGSLELDNKGSVARDHLALERTFLAWLRTSLSFASIGIAVTQLFRLNSAISCNDGESSSSSLSSSASGSDISNSLTRPSYSSSSLLEVLLAPPSTSSSNTSTKFRNIGKPLGAAFIGIAILILIIGFHRYFESQYWIVRGKFPASRGSVALVSFVAGGLVVASFAVILAVAPSAIEV